MDDYLQYQKTLYSCGGSGIDQNFFLGSNLYGQNSKPCQEFLSRKCSVEWDGVCERLSQNDGKNIVNHINQQIPNQKMTAGEILLVNSAKKKYQSSTRNCFLKFEQFNPLDPSSFELQYLEGPNCFITYEVNPRKIDSDKIMNKILDKPEIAFDLLSNIKNTMYAKRTLHQLKGTRLGKFYNL
jgi:hypothetical protein